MSNFEIFNTDHIAKLVEPYLPGATEHVTPIAYKTVTPDLFLLLFRVSNADDKEHFFVSVQYDYINEEQLVKLIGDWLGVEPIQSVVTADSDHTADRQFVSGVDDIYKAKLLLIPRPKEFGYWSDYITVNRNDDLDKVLSNLTDDQRSEVKKLLVTGPPDRVINVYKSDSIFELFYAP